MSEFVPFQSKLKLTQYVLPHHISADHHLRVESSKKNTAKIETSGRHVEGSGKSGRIRQSYVRALHRLGMRNWVDTGDPLAPRRLDHVPSHLLDLCDGSRRRQYSNSRRCAGFGCGSPVQSSCRSFPDLPSSYHPVYSSSACVLIPRSVQ